MQASLRPTEDSCRYAAENDHEPSIEVVVIMPKFLSFLKRDREMNFVNRVAEHARIMDKLLKVAVTALDRKDQWSMQRDRK